MPNSRRFCHFVCILRVGIGSDDPRIIAEQRRRLGSANPAERLAAALLIPNLLRESLNELDDRQIGQLLEDEVWSNLNLLAPESTICLVLRIGCADMRTVSPNLTSPKEESNRMKTAAIYVRVSTTDQHVESQLYDLRELATRRGFEVVQEYRDCGVSGRRARRPGLDALVADARRKKFSVVLVAAFDRVARSVKHFLQVMDEFDSLGIVFISGERT